jgi:hypothetical protein
MGVEYRISGDERVRQQLWAALGTPRSLKRACESEAAYIQGARKDVSEHTGLEGTSIQGAFPWALNFDPALLLLDPPFGYTGSDWVDC